MIVANNKYTAAMGRMKMRLLKVALAAFAAFFCLMCALQNLMNLGPAYNFVALMVGMTGHEAYPGHLGPAFHSPLIVWSMLCLIILLELIAGVLAAKGAFDLWRARRASAEEFNASKNYALLGTGLRGIGTVTETQSKSLSLSCIEPRCLMR